MSSIDEARGYVGTMPLSGLAQFALLCQVGFDPLLGVLEIGCGALHLAKPLLAVPDIRYVGVDPNEWLRNVACADDPTLARLAVNGTFSSADDFYGWPFDDPADIVFAHSVLTHASVEQMHRFMRAAYEQADRALVSVNFGVQTTAADEWTYPAAVHFSHSEVVAAASDAGWKRATVRTDLRDFYMSYRPTESHRWLYLQR